MPNRIRIQLVAPYGGVAVIAGEIAQKLDPRKINVDIIDAVGIHMLERIHFDADVVISRGVSALALRSLLPAHIPLVELKVSGYDVLRALNHCRRRYKGCVVSVIGSRNMVEGAQSVADILEIKLQYCLIATEEDAAASLDECVRNGAEVVIGGAFVCGLAKARKINSCLIESGREAILSSIEEASRVASVALKERVAAERIRTIMDVIDEGIVAVDENGAISMCNAAALRIFGELDPPLRTGRLARDVLPQFEMDAAVRDGTRVIGAIRAINRADIVANIYPLAIDNKVLGGVLTFQEAERVREFEGRIRASMRTRAHEAKYTFDHLASESPAFHNVITTAKKFSQADVNVLIFGETGTGKEIFAQSMHNASRRRKGPFVAINCAALAESLLESELFGYVAGAFTGASKSGKPGLFEIATREPSSSTRSRRSHSDSRASCCAFCRSRRSCELAIRGSFRLMSAYSPPRTATSGAWPRKVGLGRTSCTVSTSLRSAFRRCGNVRRTSASSPDNSWRNTIGAGWDDHW